MALIDTHELIEELVAAGEKKEVAVIIAKTTRQSNDNLVNKSDLKLSVAELRSEINGLRYELKEEIAEVRSELKEEIAEVRSELKEEIAEVRSELKEEIAEVRTNLKWIMRIGIFLAPFIVKTALFPNISLF